MDSYSLLSRRYPYSAYMGFSVHPVLVHLALEINTLILKYLGRFALVMNNLLLICAWSKD